MNFFKKVFGGKKCITSVMLSTQNKIFDIYSVVRNRLEHYARQRVLYGMSDYRSQSESAELNMKDMWEGPSLVVRRSG